MQTTRKRQGHSANGRKASEAKAANHGEFSLISPQKLMGLYANLLKSRALEGQQNGSSNGKGRGVGSREAALVGTAMDLGAGDLLCSLEDGLLTGLSEANAIDRLMHNPARNGTHVTGAEARNGNLGKASTHRVIGTALANKTAKNGKVAVVYSADPHSESVREAVHIASVHGLPVIFVQHANGESPARNEKTRRNSSGEETPWFPSITVDTDDVVAVYRVANEAIARARDGRGPTLIECRPFLLNGSARKRGTPEGGDAVSKMEHYLRAKGLLDAASQSGNGAERKLDR